MAGWEDGEEAERSVVETGVGEHTEAWHINKEGMMHMLGIA